MKMKNIPLNEKIIFALDFADIETAKHWVSELDGHIKFFKVGLQLFLSGGWEIIDYIQKRGNKVMLDLKFFDIPETVHLAVQQLKHRGVHYATVHGNDAILEGALKDKGDIKILAVTVLTSFDESDMRQMGMTRSVEDLVLARAKRALELGCDGLVSSPLEAKVLRENFGDKFFIVTPGIRPSTNHKLENDDQKRIATTEVAFRDGVDHIVIGRPIREAANPIEIVESIQVEISKVVV